MRLGCCLLCISLLLCLACPPRAHAVATEAAVAALVAAYLASCGLSLAANGLNANGTSGAISKMITDFLDTELGGVSIGEWGEALFSSGVTIQRGVAFVPASAANVLAKFATWANGKYGGAPGTEFVVSSSQSFTAIDGKIYFLTIVNLEDPRDFQVGTTLFVPPASRSDFSEIVIPVTSDNSIVFYLSNGYINSYFSSRPNFSLGNIYAFGSTTKQTNISFCINSYGYLTVCRVLQQPTGVPSVSLSGSSTSNTVIKATDLNITGGTLGIGVTKSVSIPDALLDNQSLKLNIDNPAADTPEAFADDVIGSVIDGTLTADAEIVDVTDVPVDPPVVEPTTPPIEPELPDVPDIDGLGLSALGAAVVTRFPFSIPWDVAHGVQLLAAPAKAPYWEVDLLEPIAYRVGGWQGDTTIVIDMSKFEIIGQLSRWTSTIGFCLILASGTKRLIWTA